MKVKSLSLTNYKGFNNFKINFCRIAENGQEIPNNVLVIAGINSVGKSSILHALRVLLSRGLFDLTGVKVRPTKFLDSDVQLGKGFAFATCDVESEGRSFTMEARLRDHENVNILKREYDRLEQEIAGLGTYNQLELDQERWNEIQLRLKSAKKKQKDLDRTIEEERIRWDIWDFTDGQKTHLPKRGKSKNANNPLVVFFSASRQIPAEKRTSLKSSQLDLKTAFNDALEDRAISIVELAQWYRLEFYLNRGRAVKEIQKAIKLFINIDRMDFFDDQLRELRFWKGDMQLRIQQLSDGERASLSIILDLSRRLAHANPGLDNPLSEGSAIVLIDEIELHLHPSWQRKIMENLTQTFPSCQFIVTTHSPQIIGEVDSNCLRLLENSEGKVKCIEINQAFGMDSSWILENLMDVDERDSDIAARIEKIFDIIDEDAQLAFAMANELEREIGKFPKLQQAKSIIANRILLMEKK